MAVRKPKLTKLNDVKEWFFLNDSSFAKIFEGLASSRKVLLRVEEATPEETWDIIEKWLPKYSGGHVTLMVSKNESYGKAASQTIVELSDSFSHSPQIGGMHGMTYVPGIGNLTPESVEQYTRNEVERAKKEWEIEKRLEDMQAQLDSPNNLTDRVIGFVEQNPAIAQAFASKLFGIPYAHLGNAVVAGTQSSEQPQEKTEEYYKNLMESIITRIESVFPNQAFEVLDRVADYVVKQPVMAKSFFGQKTTE